jgi:hypothetical protein
MGRQPDERLRVNIATTTIHAEGEDRDEGKDADEHES